MIKIKLGIGEVEINLDELKTWIVALRSGNYSQTHGRLQDKHGLCCLGVGIKVLVPEEKQVFQQWCNNTYLMGGTPYLQTGAPLWFLHINRDMERRYGKSLVALNDSDKLSFPQIADILEQVYIKPYEQAGSNIQQ